MSLLLEQIQAVVGGNGILLGSDVKNRSDSWPPAGGCKAMAIVRPASTREVSDVMKICHAANQPVVTHGGLTGLVGGGIAGPEEIVLSLERMTHIKKVDTANRCLTVEAGVRLQQVHEVAEENDLLFPLDLGARGSAMIGGNISTNAGGNSVIRYGMIRNQVLGLEAVLADGTIISSMKSVIKNNTGYDLKQLFIGTEGTLGIVTRAVLRLHPRPRSRNTALLALDDFALLGEFLRTMDSALGGTLSAFEVMWNDFYSLIVGYSDAHGLPLAASHPYYVLIEATGSHEDIDSARFERALEEAFENKLIVDAVIAQSQQQREDLWGIRDDIEGMVKGMYPPMTFDVSLGISQMDDYVNEVREKLEAARPAARMVTFGHLGDGNLHLVITVGSLNEDAVHAVEQIVYGCLQSRSGVISAEHGIGLEKRAYLPISRSPEEIDLMRTVKRAMDPKNLLNPGKIFANSAGSNG
jgi:FAD/FMN-containing dehydrogenase